MTKSRTLLAAAFATLALGAGTAFAGSEQYPSGPVLLTYSAEAVGGIGVVAHSVPAGNAAQLSALLRDWDRAGFSAPSQLG